MMLLSALQQTTQAPNVMSDLQLPTPMPPSPDISFPPEPSSPMPAPGPDIPPISPPNPGMPSPQM